MASNKTKRNWYAVLTLASVYIMVMRVVMSSTPIPRIVWLQVFGSAAVTILLFSSFWSYYKKAREDNRK